LSLEYATREELHACLDHRLAAAGNPTLLTAELLTTLCEHALGNYRVLTTMADELLAVAAQRELPQLDEKLYLEVFAPRRSGRAGSWWAGGAASLASPPSSRLSSPASATTAPFLAPGERAIVMVLAADRE